MKHLTIIFAVILFSINFANAQSVSKDIEKSYEAEELSIIVVYVPQGTEVIEVRSKTAEKITVEYTIDFSTHNEHTAKLMLAQNIAPIVKFAEYDGSRTEIKLQKQTHSIWVNGTAISSNCKSVKVIIPSHVQKFIIKEL